jgi:hypothetical protein
LCDQRWRILWMQHRLPCVSTVVSKCLTRANWRQNWSAESDVSKGPIPHVYGLENVKSLRRALHAAFLSVLVSGSFLSRGKEEMHWPHKSLTHWLKTAVCFARCRFCTSEWWLGEYEWCIEICVGLPAQNERDWTILLRTLIHIAVYSVSYSWRLLLRPPLQCFAALTSTSTN